MDKIVFNSCYLTFLRRRRVAAATTANGFGDVAQQISELHIAIILIFVVVVLLMLIMMVITACLIATFQLFVVIVK